MRRAQGDSTFHKFRLSKQTLRNLTQEQISLVVGGAVCASGNSDHTDTFIRAASLNKYGD